MAIVLSARCWKCLKKFRDEDDKCHMLNNTTEEDYVCKSCYDSMKEDAK